MQTLILAMPLAFASVALLIATLGLTHFRR